MLAGRGVGRKTSAGLTPLCPVTQRLCSGEKGAAGVTSSGPWSQVFRLPSRRLGGQQSKVMLLRLILCSRWGRGRLRPISPELAQGRKSGIKSPLRQASGSLFRFPPSALSLGLDDTGWLSIGEKSGFPDLCLAQRIIDEAGVSHVDALKIEQRLPGRFDRLLLFGRYGRRRVRAVGLEYGGSLGRG